MRKLIAAINMTLDGYCDHTAVVPTEELHQHFNELLKNTGALLYGRITYQLMEDYWPAVVKHPGAIEAINDFAVLIDNVPKIVFSKTLKNVAWKNTTLFNGGLVEEVTKLKQQPGKDLVAGSPSMIVQLTQHDLVDELQLCVHPVIVGKGLPLFKGIEHRTVLKLLKTKTLGSGAVVFYYGR